MEKITVKAVLAQNEAFDALSNGAHPTEFCALLGIPLDTHFEFCGKSVKYRQRFMRCMTECIASWRRVYRHAVFPPMEEASLLPSASYGAVEAAYERSSLLNKDQIKIIEENLKDIQQYLPCLKTLETQTDGSDSNISMTVAFELPQDKTVDDYDKLLETPG